MVDYDEKLFKYIFNIDENWAKTKEWYQKIDDSNYNYNLFPNSFKHINQDDKDIFTIKFLNSIRMSSIELHFFKRYL